ncbi:hypothetical protein BX661DRAFT_187788 [Kickxella alabastrina]|uniref:uncharacterized protein n=1 Tax=Kickxella alabastrina TaxID=61397 RepID=UPI00221F1022|nr:uncharacterized protein BX661DRAFT_187788 [Kickxella alabastrina]KAI7822119.1 hypothetical protein BX661DRAFT_187788 [Kickxella alabastrina]KAJ1947373.1 monooxygenase [Kickxella alabastrina]
MSDTSENTTTIPDTQPSHQPRKESGPVQVAMDSIDTGVGVAEQPGSIRLHAQRICVIGAGPAGLAVARVFVENKYTSVTVLERNSDIGGVWCYTPDSKSHYNVPQDSSDHAKQFGYDERSSLTHGFPTALYDDLHTNLPTDVMRFIDHDFPESTPEYPSRCHVEQYVRSYADTHDLHRLIQLNKEVISIKYDAGQKHWECKVQDLLSPGLPPKAILYDAVVVCSGRANHPYIPDVPGLRELAEARPGCIMAAREYRRATDHCGQSVLVVGGAFSGSDIARQLSYTAGNVHISMTKIEKGPDSEMDKDMPVVGVDGCNPHNMPVIHPRIECIMPNEILFTDGTAMPIPDCIIYATGYLYVYPFIDSNNPQSLAYRLPTHHQHANNELAEAELPPFTDGHKVNDMYKYLLYIHNPTLAIFGMPFRIAPFPFYEYQAHYLAHVYKGIVPLPSPEQMLDEWNKLVAEFPGKKLNEMGMLQIDYRNDLLDTVDRFSESKSDSGKRLHRVERDSAWADRCFNTLVNRKRHLGY